MDPITLEGYHLYESTKGSSQNAGTGMYVKNSINYTRREDLSITYESQSCKFESLSIEILNDKANVIIGTIYRHPNGCIKTFTNEIEQLLGNIVKKENKKIVIMGDFNINLLNHGSHKPTDYFFNNMLNQCLFPYITQPSRFTGETHTLIDNIFYNDISDQCISGNLIPQISDHLPNFLIIPYEHSLPSKKYKQQKRDFSSFNLQEFRDDIINIGFENKLTEFLDVNKMYDYFHNGIQLMLDMHAPYRYTSRK